jgi:C4-dicarboxylate-specific signal transduction histidine kinase
MTNLTAPGIEREHHQLAEVLTAAILSSEAYRRWLRKGPAHSEQATLVLQELHDLDSRIQGLTSNLLGTESDQARLERLQTDLSHAARVTVLGELAASMAHEVNQPLAASVTAAQASIRWLGRADINVDELASLSTQVVEQRAASYPKFAIWR